MNQYPPDQSQAPFESQQQPQWPPQQPPQQPVSGMQHPQSQYASVQAPDATMPMYPPTQGTPTLNAMYSRAQQPNAQSMPPGGPQDFSQHQNAFQGDQQMPQFPHQQPFGQQPQPNMPTNQEAYGETAPQGQQYFYTPDLSTVYEQTEGSQSGHPGLGPAATAWEQEHVTEVNDDPQFTGFTQPAGLRVPQNPDRATREAELFAARQRVQALEAEREEREFSRVMAISARDAPDDAELEEQLQQQLHQAQLLSLTAYEEDIRRQIEQHSNVAYDDDPYTPMASGAAHTGFNYSDPRGGSPLYSPAPTLQGHNAAQQPQYHPPASHAAPSQAASGIYHPEVVSPTASHVSQPHPYDYGGPTQMPPPTPPNPAGPGNNFGWTSPSPSQYTGRSVYSPSISEASTVRNGSKGKGRMP